MCAGGVHRRKVRPPPRHKVGCGRRARDAIPSCHVERVGSLALGCICECGLRKLGGPGVRNWAISFCQHLQKRRRVERTSLCKWRRWDEKTCKIFARVGPSVVFPGSIASHHRLETVVCPPTRLAPLACET